MPETDIKNYINLKISGKMRVVDFAGAFMYDKENRDLKYKIWKNGEEKMRKRIMKLMAMGIAASIVFTSGGGSIGPVVYAAEAAEQEGSGTTEEANAQDESVPEDADGADNEETTPEDTDGAENEETTPEDTDGVDGEETTPEDTNEADNEDETGPEDTEGDNQEGNGTEDAEGGEEQDGPSEVEDVINSETGDVLPDTVIETEITGEMQEIVESKLETALEEETAYSISSDTVIIDIRDFGAGNQDADADTQALQKALDFMQSEECARAGLGAMGIRKIKIVIPQGTYYINSALRLSSDAEIAVEDGAVLHLQPEEMTFINPDGAVNFRLDGGTWIGSGNCLTFDISGNVEIANMVLEEVGLSIQGKEGDVARNSEDASGSNTTIRGCTINGGSNGFGIRVREMYSTVTVESNTVNNVSGNGILVLGANCSVKKNTVTGTQGSAIYAENTRNFTADGNILTNHSGRGIAAVNIDGVTAVNNKIKKSGEDGILVYANCRGTIRIEGNTVEESGMANLTVGGGDSVVIKGNSFLNGAKSGIYIEHIKGVSIEDNTMSGNAQEGILIYDSANDKILRNTVSNNGTRGILIHTNADKPKVDGNTVENNKGDGIVTDNVDAPEITNNRVKSNNIGIYTCRCNNALIKGNTTETNRNKGIYVEGNLNNSGACTEYPVTITENTVRSDNLSGILVFHAKATIQKNNVSDTGAGVGEGVVVQYSGGSMISENNISGVKSALYNNGNGIIVANNSEDVMVYKNKVNASGNHGIQVTYSSKNVTVLANDVSNSGHQGITFSRNSSGAIAGNRVRQSRNHGIINEDSSVRTGGNYVAGVGEECIAYNRSSGTVKGNVIVNGRVFIANGTVANENNTVAPGETEDNPYVTEPRVEDFVNRLYQKVLGRASEEAGRLDWTTRLLVRDQSGAVVARGFFFSDEYSNKKTSDSSYVDTLYSAMFDRAADAGGKSGWIKDFATGFSREFVYKGFAESEEFQNLCNRFGIERGIVEMREARDKNRGVTEFVSRIYTKALSRKKVDTAGLNDWCSRILTGVSPKEVVAGFIFSEEFTNRKLSNDAFVKVMYETYFDRPADKAGYNDWMSRLSKGATIQDVVDGFSESEEFDNLIKSFGL